MTKRPCDSCKVKNCKRIRMQKVAKMVFCRLERSNLVIQINEERF